MKPRIKNPTGQKVLLLVTILINVSLAYAGGVPYVTTTKTPGAFTLFATGKPAPLYISDADYEGVMIALKSFQGDVKAVTGIEPALFTNDVKGKEVVIVGTIGKSPLIDKLVQDKKLNVAGIQGKWEVFISQVVKNPMPGVENALVIAGSDKRGTIYGIYDLSAQIGVSPWYYWSDVPIKHKNSLYVAPGRHTDGTPAVKYRGIFINDEGPSFLGWAKAKFDGLNKNLALNGKVMDQGVNHYLYVHMFDLLLRLKANFLWPAMWNNAFNDDDPESALLADKMGIVMGTSHHEPMDRAQKEWGRYNAALAQPQKAWNYATNGDVLKEYWKKGIERNNGKEVLTTVGMRGDGDEAMAPGGPAANMALLEKIIKEQRESIAKVAGKDAAEIPQVWALYKEVQDYFDAGMRVPDDITMLYCDDNWGNVRRLPNLNDPKRPGGYGLYYHFDYHGGPRNYQWVNSNPLPHTWEQMHLAYEYGVKTEWIVNVGDLKSLELPISFFLDYAWNPDKYPANSLEKYTRDWAAQQFGPEHAAEIASIMSTYGKYNGRRKPELVDPTTIRTSTPYSLTDYREFETVVTDYNKLKAQTEKLSGKIPAEYKDAFYALVLHPVEASANFNEMYLASAKNKWYGQQGRTSANDEAAKASALFAKDAEITKYYNTVMAGGKWDHMMDQVHIGYMSWDAPRGGNKLPAFIKVNAPVNAEMGVSIEGSAAWWPQETTVAVLPEFTRYPNTSRYLEIFNRGQAPFAYTVETGVPYVNISPKSGKITKQERLWVSIDWARAPEGTRQVPITITGANGIKVVVQAIVNNSKPVPKSGFVLSNGYASMEAIHYSKAVDGPHVKWTILPDRGRTLAAMEASPVTAARQEPGGNSPHLIYNVNIADTGIVKVRVFVAPSIDFTHEKGLWYAISIDGETPQMVNIDPLVKDPRIANGIMEAASANEIKELITIHHITQPGMHAVKYWLVDPSVVLEKIVVDAGGVKPSYFGPPESYRVMIKSK